MGGTKTNKWKTVCGQISLPTPSLSNIVSWQTCVVSGDNLASVQERTLHMGCALSCWLWLESCRIRYTAVFVCNKYSALSQFVISLEIKTKPDRGLVRMRNQYSVLTLLNQPQNVFINGFHLEGSGCLSDLVPLLGVRWEIQGSGGENPHFTYSSEWEGKGAACCSTCWLCFQSGRGSFHQGPWRESARPGVGEDHQTVRVQPQELQEHQGRQPFEVHPPSAEADATRTLNRRTSMEKVFEKSQHRCEVSVDCKPSSLFGWKKKHVYFCCDLQF